MSIQRNYLSVVLMAMALATLLCTCARAQNIPERFHTGYEQLDDKLAGMIRADEYALNAQEAHELDDALFLDAREPVEYKISHLPGAQYVGYDDVDYYILDAVEKDRPIVVYCTVGYRSERVADAIRERGFTQVYNLYGSLYAWKMAGYRLEDNQGKETEAVHTYNRKWSKLAPDSIGDKVW